ncbi:MAG TPA: hypothetical protein VJI46_02925, partial [Candidatus Nanoarchaeia archaeon]|nr:hypothetical protein [Candidatus Nanoarchaeia archaeon]
MRGKINFLIFIPVFLLLIPFAASDGRCGGDNNNQDIAPSDGASGFSRVCASDGDECTRDCSCRSNGEASISISNTDCISSATMSEVYFDDKGKLDINGEVISDDNCDEAGEVDGLQDEELKRNLQETDSAAISITNFNKFGSGASDALFTITYGQPDDAEDLCKGAIPCTSICDGNTQLLGKIACAFEDIVNRVWIGEEAPFANGCCGDDQYKEKEGAIPAPIEQMLPNCGQTDPNCQPDTPDLSTEFCTGC